MTGSPVVVAVGALAPAGGGDEYQVLGTLCRAQWLPAVLLLASAGGLRRPSWSCASMAD